MRTIVRRTCPPPTAVSTTPSPSITAPLGFTWRCWRSASVRVMRYCRRLHLFCDRARRHVHGGISREKDGKGTSGSLSCGAVAADNHVTKVNRSSPTPHKMNNFRWLPA